MAEFTQNAAHGRPIWSATLTTADPVAELPYTGKPDLQIAIRRGGNKGGGTLALETAAAAAADVSDDSHWVAMGEDASLADLLVGHAYPIQMAGQNRIKLSNSTGANVMVTVQ